MDSPQPNPQASKKTQLSRSVNSPESDWDGLDPSSDAARRADDAGLEPDESVNLDDTVGPDQGPADKPTSLPDRT